MYRGKTVFMCVCISMCVFNTIPRSAISQAKKKITSLFIRTVQKTCIQYIQLVNNLVIFFACSLWTDRVEYIKIYICMLFEYESTKQKCTLYLEKIAIFCFIFYTVLLMSLLIQLVDLKLHCLQVHIPKNKKEHLQKV